MKLKYFIPALSLLLAINPAGYAQQNNKPNVFDKANNTVNKVSNVIAVFQPYLLKARQLFMDGKQLAGDVRNAAKNNLGNGNNSGQNNTPYTSSNNSNGYSNTGGNTANSNNSGNGNSNNNYNNSSNTGNSSNAYNGNNSGNSGNAYNGNNGTGNSNDPNMANMQSYLPGQSLPVNNPSSINNDATGNWGNQNNGLYGNCLDVMTGTVMGMGEAAQSPGAVDLMFFAPADGQNTYTIMTPGFARNNSTAGYMTEHVSEQVLHWTDANETEVALTKISIGQFNQIQNNSQIQNAVRNAQDYAGYYTSVGNKLDGQVLAVKMQMDNREVYALVAVIKQLGTSGSNGYLKIKIKSTGIDTNRDGQADAGAYLRNNAVR